jgi:hypothetical protein
MGDGRSKLSIEASEKRRGNTIGPFRRRYCSPCKDARPLLLPTSFHPLSLNKTLPFRGDSLRGKLSSDVAWCSISLASACLRFISASKATDVQ